MEAASYTVYTLNRVLSKVSPVTPYEAWHNAKPNLSHLRVFGSAAYIHVPKVERRKLDPKSLRCIFVGYSQTQKAYRFWVPATRTIKISRDVTFDEFHHYAGLSEEPTDPADRNICLLPPVPTTVEPMVCTDEESATRIHQEPIACLDTEPQTHPLRPWKYVNLRPVAPFVAGFRSVSGLHGQPLAILRLSVPTFHAPIRRQ